MRHFVTAPAIILLPLLSASLVSADALDLQVRRQVKDTGGLEGWKTVVTPVEWNAHETAVIVCDMWDQHWCRGATARVAEMAPRMNEVLSILRGKGALIIHCPSNCMKFYEGTPQRKLVRDTLRSWSPAFTKLFTSFMRPSGCTNPGRSSYKRKSRSP